MFLKKCKIFLNAAPQIDFFKGFRDFLRWWQGSTNNKRLFSFWNLVQSIKSFEHVCKYLCYFRLHLQITMFSVEHYANTNTERQGLSHMTGLKSYFRHQFEDLKLD